MKSKITKMLLLLLFFCFYCNQESALAEEITITKTYESNNTEEKYAFEKEYSEDGIKYVWQKTTYNIVKTDEKFIIENFDKKVFIPNLLTDDKATLPQSIVEDDIEFKLQDAEFKLVDIDMFEDVYAHLTSDWVTSKPEFAETLTTEYKPNSALADGLLTIKLPLQSVDIAEDYAWRDDLVLSLTVKNYDAEYYIFNGKQFYYNELHPEIDADSILAYFGLPKDNYKIKRVEWAGEPYKNAAGVSCRDVKITGDRYVAKYIATYTDKVVVGTANRYNANLNYVGEKKTPTGEVTYTIEATAIYKKILPTPTPEPTAEPEPTATPEPTIEATVEPKPTVAPTIEPEPTEIPDEPVPKASPVKPVVITIGIMLLIILIVAVIYTISKKKKINSGKENKKS